MTIHQFISKLVTSAQALSENDNGEPVSLKFRVRGQSVMSSCQWLDLVFDELPNKINDLLADPERVYTKKIDYFFDLGKLESLEGDFDLFDIIKSELNEIAEKANCVIIGLRPKTLDNAFEFTPFSLANRYWKVIQDVAEKIDSEPIYVKRLPRKIILVVADPSSCELAAHINALNSGDESFLTQTRELAFGSIPNAQRDAHVRRLQTKKFRETLRDKLGNALHADIRCMLANQLSWHGIKGDLEIYDPDKKDGNVLLVGSSKVKGQFWCKFGSSARLTAELSNAIRVRAEEKLRDFVYVLLGNPLFHVSSADYTAMLTSESLSSETHGFWDAFSWSGEIDLDAGGADAYHQFFSDLNDFFNVFHADATGGFHIKSVEESGSRLLGIYRQWFDTRHLEYEGGDMPVRLSKGDGTESPHYRIDAIRPHDSLALPDREGGARITKPAVSLYLSSIDKGAANPDSSTSLKTRFRVRWHHNVWRERFWKEELREGSEVKIEASDLLSARPAGRIHEHVKKLCFLLDNGSQLTGNAGGESDGGLRPPSKPLQELFDNAKRVESLSLKMGDDEDQSGPSFLLSGLNVKPEFEIFGGRIHGDFHSGNLLVSKKLTGLKSGKKRSETEVFKAVDRSLRVIDFANTVFFSPERTGDDFAPLSIDHTVFDVEYRSRFRTSPPAGLQANDDLQVAANDEERRKTLIDLYESEIEEWKHLSKQYPEVFNNPSVTKESLDHSDLKLLKDVFNRYVEDIAGKENLVHIAFARIWRMNSLIRLCHAVQAANFDNENLKNHRQLPFLAADSYLRGVLLCGLGQSLFIDPSGSSARKAHVPITIALAALAFFEQWRRDRSDEQAE